MDDSTYRLLAIVGVFIEIALVPLLYAIAYYLRGIQTTIAEINHALVAIKQWKEDHDERDDERFQAVHARVGRLEERVDSCQVQIKTYHARP